MADDLSLEEYTELYEKRFGEMPPFMIGASDEWYYAGIKKAVKTGIPFNSEERFYDEFESEEPMVLY